MRQCPVQLLQDGGKGGEYPRRKSEADCAHTRRRGGDAIKKYVLLLSLLVSAPAVAQWDAASTQREVLWQIINVLDLGTTLDIENHPELYETNPIFGKHPSRERVYALMVVGAVVHYAVSKALKPKYRRYWQHFTIATSAAYVSNNFSLGLRLRF